MSFYSILLGIQYVSVVLMIFLSIFIVKKWNKPSHGWLFFYSITTLVNNAGYLALMQCQTEREGILIWQFTYICRAWIPFTLLKFGLLLTTGKRYQKITSVLCYFHAIIYVMVLTMKFNPLYYRSYSFIEDGIFPHFVFTPGPLHFILDALVLSYVFVVLRLLFLSIKKEKNKYKRRQFIIVSIAIFMASLFYISKFFHPIPGYDMTVMGFTVADIFFYIGIFGFDILDTKNMSEAVVVHDEVKASWAETQPGNESVPPAGSMPSSGAPVPPAAAMSSEAKAKSKIEAFGDYDMRVRLPLTEILYFEADAEQVFAYTKDEIYNVKLRLYQVEEISQSAGIIRVSKSHLINVKKIESVRPAINSRLYVKMLNGEEILVSRKYAHSLKEAIA
jgi:hypothetical protein